MIIHRSGKQVGPTHYLCVHNVQCGLGRHIPMMVYIDMETNLIFFFLVET